MSDLGEQEIGANLRAARLERGLTQAQLSSALAARGAEAALRWAQTITKIELGARPLRLSEAVQIAQVLGITLDEIAGGEAVHTGRSWRAGRVSALRVAGEAIARLLDDEMQS